MLKRSSPHKTATSCNHCGKTPTLISKSLGLCYYCIRHDFMADLPTTSLQHAERCLAAAKDAGLRQVRLGNVHLLRNE